MALLQPSWSASACALVLVGVIVDDVHLVALRKHARVGGADAPCPDDANRLVLRGGVRQV